MSESKAKTLDDSNFRETIEKGVTLVDFWAEWCGPCRIQGPIVDRLAGKFDGESTTIGKLNVDENQAIAQEYEITSIPTIILFKDGKPEKRMVGVQEEGQLEDAINSL